MIDTNGIRKEFEVRYSLMDKGERHAWEYLMLACNEIDKLRTAGTEALDALKLIVAPSGTGHSCGHDAIVGARSIVHKQAPEWYEKRVTARRKKAGLPILIQTD